MSRPATPVSALDEVLEDADLILIMSVNPGFGGQKFIPSALEKIRELVEIRHAEELDFEIEIDGGAKLDNVQEIVSAGTDIVVAGSAVFKTPDIEETTKQFISKIRSV